MISCPTTNYINSKNHKHCNEGNKIGLDRHFETQEVCESMTKHCTIFPLCRTCVSGCPEGFWGDRKRCKKCFSSCKTCEGSRSNQCTSCKLSHHFNEDTNSCVTSCGDGYYVEHGKCAEHRNT